MKIMRVNQKMTTQYKHLKKGEAFKDSHDIVFIKVSGSGAVNLATGTLHEIDYGADWEVLPLPHAELHTNEDRK